MEDDILDNFDNRNTNIRSVVNRILLISVSTIVFYFLLEEVRRFLPENLISREDLKIKTIGLIVIAIVLLNAILLPTYLNKISPKLNKYAVAAYTGLIVFAVEVVFRIVQILLSFIDGSMLSFLLVVKGAVIWGVIGGLVANIRIHKLRGEKVLVPVLLMVGIWLVVGRLL